MPGSFAKHFLLICTDAKCFAIFCKGHLKVTLQLGWALWICLQRDEAARQPSEESFLLRCSLIPVLLQNLCEALLPQTSFLPEFSHVKKMSMSHSRLSWTLKGHPLPNGIVWKLRSRETGKHWTQALLFLEMT